MEKKLLNELTENRKKKCEDKHINIDLIEKKAKGYCKAKDFNKSDSFLQAFPQEVKEKTNFTHPNSSDSDDKPSEVFLFILKDLGVDYIE